MKVLNFGSLNIDHTYHVDDFVRKGQTITSLDEHDYLGGKGLNQSISLKRSGTDVYHIGAIGEDGDMLLEALQAEKIDTSYLQRLEGPSGHTIIQISAEGDNAIIVHGGTNRMLTRSYIDEVFDAFSDEKCVVLLQNEVSEVPYIINRAHKDGHIIVLNPSPIDDCLLGAQLDYVDLFILNESEGFSLTGEKDSKAILDGMSLLYPNAVVVLTLGSDGSICSSNEERIEQQAIFVENVVDTTGAGDTFTGYFLTSLLQGEDHHTALERASVASAMSITVNGAVDSIPNIQNVTEKILEGKKSDN